MGTYTAASLRAARRWIGSEYILNVGCRAITKLSRKKCVSDIGRLRAELQENAEVTMYSNVPSYPRVLIDTEIVMHLHDTRVCTVASSKA